MICSGSLYDICFKQGSSFSLIINVTGSDGNPTNISGYTGSAPIAHKYGDTGVLGYFNLNITNSISGQITMSLNYSETAALPVTQAVYELELENPQGERSKYLYGYLNINPQL